MITEIFPNSCNITVNRTYNKFKSKDLNLK